MDFLDIASRYAQNRFDNAMPDLSNGFDPEEERRRRLEREARERAAAEAVPVTQTVKTNPVTGEQEMTIKGSPHDLSAANPLTPTVTGPVAPKMTPAYHYPMVTPPANPMLGVNPSNNDLYTDMTVGSRVGPNNEEIVGPNGQTYNYNALKQAADNHVTGLPQNAMPVDARSAEIPVQQPRPPIAQLHPDHQAAIDRVLPPAAGQAQPMPTSEPMVARPPAAVAPPAPVVPAPMPVAAPAAPMAMPVVAPAPVTAQGPVNPAAPAPAMPMVAPVEQAGPPTSLMSPGGWQDRITTAKTGQDYRQIMSDPNTPEPIAQLAAGRYAESLKQSKEEKIANDIVDRVGTDPKAANDLTRAIRKNTEEGSYIKAVLFARLGLNDLAKEEQQKLGAGNQFQSIIQGNERYTAEVNGQGAITRAFTADGSEVSNKVLSQLNAQGALGKGAVTGQTFGKDAKGDVISHTILPNGRGVQWKNETTGETLGSAPAGYHSMGQKSLDQLEAERAVGTAANIETKMRKANSDASLMGLPTPYSEQAITAEKNKVRVGAGTPTMGGSGPSASQIAQNGGINISPNGGTRDTQGQANQVAQWYANGMKGPRPAEPGTSAHESDRAIDVPANQRTPANRAYLESQGMRNTVPGEPWHFELPKKVAVEATGNPATSSQGASVAEKIANYEMKPPQSRSPMYAQMMKEVARINPDYDETKFTTINKTRQAFTTGTQGNTVRSMNVAVDHLDTLDKAAKALNNSDARLFNQIANEYQRNVGGPAITDFNAVKSIVGSEVAKAVSGAGGSALGDREEIRKEIDAANSPGQLASVIKKYQDLMVGQLNGLKTQYNDSGLKDFDNKLNPRTKQILRQIEHERRQTRSNW